MNVNSFKAIVAKIDYYSGLLYNSCYCFGVTMLGRIMYPIIILMHPRVYVTSPSYFPESPRKSKYRILFDQLFWSIKYGDINKYYFMWGGDIVGSSLCGFVPWFRFTNARQKKNKLPQKPEYDYYNQVGLLRDKFYFETILRKTGYSTPLNLFMVNDGKLYSLNNSIPTKGESLKEILNFEIDAFCKKNVGYGGGYDDDVFSIRVKNREIYLSGKNVEFCELERRLLHSSCSWVIQERINNQAKFMSEFHPNSINTIRIVTVKQNNVVEAICAFARFGANGRGSDNFSSGGVLVGINVQNGAFEDYGLFKPGVGTICYAHPDTNVSFKGQIVPMWNEIIEYVKSLHELFYDLHSIGWDVCLTDDGPMIIEGNDNWDTIDAQFYRPANDLYIKYFK